MSSHRRSQQHYVATLALIAGAILFVGYWLKPSRVAEPTASRAETSRLRRLTQRANLEDLTEYFNEIANDVEGSLVWIPALRVSGLIWSPEGLVVAPGIAPVVDMEAVTVGGTIPMEQVADATGEMASAYTVPVTFGLQAPDHANPELVRLGEWVLQVTRGEDGRHRFTQATFGGTATVRCNGQIYEAIQSSLPVNQASLGSGIFDIDGDLLAMVVRCEEGYAALTTDSIDLSIAEAGTLRSRLQRVMGFTVRELNGPASDYFEAPTGVWVDSVRRLSAPATQQPPQPVLQPGDVIVSIDGDPVITPSDLEALFAGGQAPFTLEVIRDRRSMELSFTPPVPISALAPAPETGSGTVGISLAPQPQPAAGFPIGTVTPGSAADSAGLATGDRLLSINGEVPANAAEAAEFLGSMDGQTAFVVFERNGIRRGAFLP